MKSNKELYKIWKENIAIPIYRVVPKRTLTSLKKNGADPNKHWSGEIYKKFMKLFSIVYRLEKRGFVMLFRDGKVTGKFVCQELTNDVSKKYIDFCGAKEQTEYYLKLTPGGATARAIKSITKRLLEEKPILKKSDWKLIHWLNNWAKSMICENKVIYVNGDSPVFETALFQLTGTHKGKKRKSFSESPYLPSPFGSLEHFKKTLKKVGINKYLPRWKNKRFYLRVKSKIPARNINFQ